MTRSGRMAMRLEWRLTGGESSDEGLGRSGGDGRHDGSVRTTTKELPKQTLTRGVIRKNSTRRTTPLGPVAGPTGGPTVPEKGIQRAPDHRTRASDDAPDWSDGAQIDMTEAPDNLTLVRWSVGHWSDGFFGWKRFMQ